MVPTVIAASMHGLLQPTCSHNHKLLAAGSAEIKSSAAFGIFLNLRKLRDLGLDLGSGQGHIGMHSITCSTTCIPNRLTVASRTTEIWLFEFREISTFRDA